LPNVTGMCASRHRKSYPQMTGGHDTFQYYTLGAWHVSTHWIYHHARPYIRPHITTSIQQTNCTHTRVHIHCTHSPHTPTYTHTGTHTTHTRAHTHRLPTHVHSDIKRIYAHTHTQPRPHTHFAHTYCTHTCAHSHGRAHTGTHMAVFDKRHH
jgi:hypothetical protein